MKVHQQIGSITGIRPRIKIFAPQHVADGRTFCRSIWNLRQTALNRIADPLSFSSLSQHSLALAALEVEINSAKSHCISVSARPIYGRKTIADVFARLLPVFQR